MLPSGESRTLGPWTKLRIRSGETLDEFGFVHFPGPRSGQRRHNLNLFRAGMKPKTLGPEESAKRTHIKGWFYRAKFQYRAHSLTRSYIWKTDGHAISDLWMRAKELFDFSAPNVLAVADDDLLESTCDH